MAYSMMAAAVKLVVSVVRSSETGIVTQDGKAIAWNATFAGTVPISTNVSAARVVFLKL